MSLVKVKMTQPNGDVLGRAMDDRIRTLVRLEGQARKQAAAAATRASSRQITYLRPTNTPARPGRSATGGKLGSKVKWSPSAQGSTVDLDTAQLDREAPHWIIEEIGTGQRATVKRGGGVNPRGRPSSGASYIRTVKSQRGRRISRRLAFGTGPRGAYVPPSPGMSGQGLYLRRNLRGAPSAKAATAMVIKKEVVGKHFVQAGAIAGFREYRVSVRAAAQSAFGGHPRR